MDYVVGEDRAAERLGDIDFLKDWSKYSTPVDIGDTEYAFGRCSKGKKEAVLVNKYNATAAQRAAQITESLRKQLNLTTSPRPLAVYMLIFDSVSRQHFYRNFPQTVDFLNSAFESEYHDHYLLYDFVVNNAHGENTQPNMVPWLYGYALKYLKIQLQGLSVNRPQDQSRFLELQEEALWKVFERHGFVTLFGFDTVWDFLSHCTGRSIATDHMLSNFYHACRKLFGYMDFVERQRCIGLHNAHFYALSYLLQFNDNYKGLNRFAYMHLSPGHEKSGTVIRTADEDTKDFLRKLLNTQRSRPEEDFVLVLAADHGKHSSEWDKSFEGFLENQLPLHLLFASSPLISRLHAHFALTHNSQRLVSRLDWHLSFLHMSTFPYGQLRANSSLYTVWKQRSDSSLALSVFLEPVPDSRGCEDVDIPVHYCSCLDFVEIPLVQARDMTPIKDLVQLSIRYLNSVLKREDAGDICYSLSLEAIFKVFVQVLKGGEAGSRNFKVRFGVNEGRETRFEAIGLLASAQELASLQNSEPLVNTTFTASDGTFFPMQLLLREVIRVDQYEGLCEELAKTAGASPPYCVCKVPFPAGSFSPKQVAVIEKLMSRMEMVIAKRGQPCHLACLERNRGCHIWALQLFNDERILRQGWRPTTSYLLFNLTDGSRLRFSDINIVDVQKESSIIRLLRKSYSEWSLELAAGTKGPNCDQHTYYAFGLCPCF